MEIRANTQTNLMSKFKTTEKKKNHSQIEGLPETRMYGNLKKNPVRLTPKLRDQRGCINPPTQGYKQMDQMAFSSRKCREPNAIKY